MGACWFHTDRVRPEAAEGVEDSANESCPIFPGAVHRLHWSFPDPSAVAGTEARRLAAFREVRAAITARLVAWLGEQGITVRPLDTT